MKFSVLLLPLLPAVLALPTDSSSSSSSSEQSAGLAKRQTSLSAITDQYLFSLTLPQFTAKRNAKSPSTLDWTSDGCTDSPDNPFGFPFVPACNRHDFGYQNYRAQSRFSETNKAKIDSNFKTDLYYQCGTVSLTGVCKALADVYYAAVKAFGGGDAYPGKRDDALIREYEEKVAIYNQLVAEAQANGDLWVPN
ncbi:prokaryotic phospholipase A2-domain-containing protein [Bombardia bombarda]|uniref:Prokaryotic phospholipase A2-domain-containing protein n=1 Tax=Bombardia bombarda TaxID=252184 RepID=A0AA39WAT6_9PEZI|nr:prokaryotic phospholipase A2-domain-containing protein [Bombardia bombarda]